MLLLWITGCSSNLKLSPNESALAQKLTANLEAGTCGRDDVCFAEKGEANPKYRYTDFGGYVYSDTVQREVNVFNAWVHRHTGENIAIDSTMGTGWYFHKSRLAKTLYLPKYIEYQGLNREIVSIPFYRSAVRIVELWEALNRVSPSLTLRNLAEYARNDTHAASPPEWLLRNQSRLNRALNIGLAANTSLILEQKIHSEFDRTTRDRQKVRPAFIAELSDLEIEIASYIRAAEIAEEAD